MSSIFYLKRGDVRPGLQVTLTNPDGTAYNLTGADQQKLHITLERGARLTRDLEVVNATGGIVRYLWVVADWNAGNLVVGEHRMEYQITRAEGPISFPNNGFHVLKIAEDLS